MSFPLSDRVLHAEYLVGLERRTLPEIRAMRAECEEAEAGVSFARRVLQGHLDIVANELARRMNHQPSDPAVVNALHDLVERLPQILADEPHSRSGSPGWRPLDLNTEMPGVELLVAVDAAVGGAAMADLASRAQEDIEHMSGRLSELEREFSRTRRILHERIDLLKNEITARYGRGEINVDTLLD
ncbi:MAG: hypothetical protein ACKV2O_09220 [Acidimicrobiales bacterium]